MISATNFQGIQARIEVYEKPKDAGGFEYIFGFTATCWRCGSHTIGGIFRYRHANEKLTEAQIQKIVVEAISQRHECGVILERWTDTTAADRALNGIDWRNHKPAPSQLRLIMSTDGKGKTIMHSPKEGTA